MFMRALGLLILQVLLFLLFEGLGVSVGHLAERAQRCGASVDV